jgi:hypothetical protein
VLHDGIYGGDISNSSLIPQLDYVDMDALVLAEDIAGITLEYGKLSILNTMGPA